MFILKVFSLLVVFTVGFALILEPTLNEKFRGEKYIKELQLSAAKQIVAPLNERTFRLPNNTEPVSYNISLSTEIHRGVFAYDGDITINIRALEDTNNITLHSRHIIVQRIDLRNPNGTLYQADVSYIYDSELHFLVITFMRNLEVGQELAVEISYVGFIRDDMLGFFRNSYNNPVNETVWLATTYLTPVNARQAFPCYDEPRYRRPFNLQIRHHRNYTAISNMPSDRIDDGEYVITVFQRTLPVATYTLSFTISDFDWIENTDLEGVVPMGVYARPTVIALSQANETLRFGERMFREMLRWIDIPYALPKIDQVVLPQLRFTGFEGWGLISHHENVILRFPDRSRERRIAHEHAHMYFGNLVTPGHWAHIWLSEGFATLYEHMITDVPGAGWIQFLIENFDVAITLDVNGLLPALNSYVESVQEITNKFSFGIFYKAAIVFRMIGDGVHVTTWSKAVRYFLLDNYLGSVSAQSLYDAVQKAYDEDYPEGPLNLTEIMSPWFDLQGYPVVTVRRSGDNLILTQEGFKTLHDELFPIPITYATARYPDFDDVFPDYWLTERELEISGATASRPWTDEDWIIVNLRDTAYFLTNYDAELWDRIINALNTDHEAIHFFNRGTLFADFHRFIAQDFDISIVIFIRMMESLPLEFHPHVWIRAALGIDLNTVRFRATEFDASYMNFMQEIMSQVYGEIAFDDRDAINLINNWSCLSGVQECLDDALEVLLEVMERGETDFEFDYQCNGLRAANESIWRDFYFHVVDDSTGDRSTDLRDLLCTENENSIIFYLNQALNETNSLTTSEREVILITAASQHETSYYQLMNLIEYNSEEIGEITSVSNLILELAMVTNNYIYAETVLSLMQFSDDEDITEDFITETMQPNMNFIYRNYDALRQWFGGR